MAISYIGAGTQINGSTSLANVPYPSGITAGDLILFPIANKYVAATPTTPSGFTLLGSYNGTAGSDGVEDEGGGNISIYARQATGAESGTLTVTVTGANCATGGMLLFRNTSLRWSYTITGVSRNSTGSTLSPWDVSATITTQTGDVLFISSFENSNLHAMQTSPTITKTGDTFAAAAKPLDGSTTNGTNVRMPAHYAAVTVGTGTGTVSFSSTLTGTPTTTHPAGATAFLVLREPTSGGNGRGTTIGAYIRI